MKTGSKRSHILLASFLLPAGVMTAALALTGVVPFGGRSLGVQDMSFQYLAFLRYLRDVLTGQASALYLPSMALGGGASGLMAYYLMSPLDLVACLFPREGLLTAATVIYVLRVGLCGLAMALYCGSRRGWSRRVLIPALGYALMAYMLANSINYQWHDSVILLPIVALSIARLAEGRGWRLYVLALAAALAVNFYIGYMLCIFSVLWFVFELLTGQGSRPRGKAVVRFVLGSLGAGALAAAVLVPAFLALRGGKAGFSLSDLSLAPKFPLRSLFAKFFPGAFNFDELNPSGLPSVFTGTVTAALAVLYLANGSIPRRRRVGGAVLAGCVAASFWVSALDLIWHGLNAPIWYNYRYSFLFSFLLAAGADVALARLREGTRPVHLLLPMGVVAVCALLAFAGRSYGFVTWRAALIAGGAVLLTCGGLYLILRPGASRRVLAAAGALVLLVHIGEMGYNAVRSLDGLTVSSADSVQWAAYVTEKAAAMAAADVGDAFVRVESPERFDTDRCEPMLFGYDGLSHYSSTVSQKSLDFLQKLGLTRYEGLFALYGAGVPAGADSLLGVGRLVMAATDKPYRSLSRSGRYTIYENPYALPVGWTADAAFADTLDADGCFAYIQALYDAAAPEVGQDIYVPARVTDAALEGLTETDGRYTLAASSGSVTYTLVPAADGPLYAWLDIPDYPGVMVYVNGGFLTFTANANENGTLCLGTYAAGETVALRVQAFTDFTMDRAVFATESADALAAYHDAIAPGGCPLTKLSDSHFTGSFITGEGDGLLILTIPCDSGWRIALDGTRAEAIQVQDCLTAIPVTAGTHTLDMRYVPPGLICGYCISAVAAALCLGTWLLSRRKKHTHP